MKVYKIYKCRRQKNISPKELVEQIAIPMIKKGNRKNTYYKIVLDDIWNYIYDHYNFDLEASGIVREEIWNCFEKYCDQYRSKYHIK